MNSAPFPQSTHKFGPPPDLAESQVRTIDAFVGVAHGGSLDGETFVVTCWQPTPEERDRIACGGNVFLTVMGGLPPHFVTASFEEATNVA